MKKDNVIFVKHILESIERIERFLRDISKEKFFKDELLQSGVVRQIEIIGEASKNVSEDFRERYSDIEWRGIAGMRDKLIHGYFGVDIERVWNVFEKDLPILKREIEKILRGE